MPVSTERHSGFPISKWELNYLHCRYLAHRNKIAAAKPAIDANPPPERPHVNYKKKKALLEERRQMRIVQENLRLLGRTINIMASTDMPTHFSHARPSQTATKNIPGVPFSSATPAGGNDRDLDASTTTPTTSVATGESSGRNPKAAAEKAQQRESSQEQQQREKGKRKRTSNDRKYFDRPLTARLKRNTHIIFHWFIQRFGRYVPWWAEINY